MYVLILNIKITCYKKLCYFIFFVHSLFIINSLTKIPFSVNLTQILVHLESCEMEKGWWVQHWHVIEQARQLQLVAYSEITVKKTIKKRDNAIIDNLETQTFLFFFSIFYNPLYFQNNGFCCL